MPLAEDAISLVRSLYDRAYSEPVPSVHYHYTKAAGLSGIAESRSFWANCTTVQTDPTEFAWGCGLVEEKVKHLLARGCSSFISETLELLGASIRSRREYTFILCFCDDSSSAHHRENFGPYCLRTSTGEFGLNFVSNDVRDEVWCQPVIYDYAAQVALFTNFVEALPSLISRHITGDPEGFTTKRFSESIARTLGQLLLLLISGCKRSEFMDEREWRIVCCPKITPFYSAPSLIDENFAVSIRPIPKRHIELRRKYRIGTNRNDLSNLGFYNHLRSPCPFEGVINLQFVEEKESTNVLSVLRRNCNPSVYATLFRTS